MTAYEQTIHRLYDDRISTLGRIKARSFDADVLTLTALRVLVYAQLEGGIKEQVSLVIRQINAYKLEIGETSPTILSWRNQEDLSRFRAAVNFHTLCLSFPFGNMPAKRVKVRPINRLREFNQMNFQSLAEIYAGLGLSSTAIQQYSSDVNDLVGARNDAAHHGLMPAIGKAMLEGQVRGDAELVGRVLTDAALQLLVFFTNKLHRR